MVMNMFVTDQTNNKIDHDTSTGVVDVGIELKDWPRELKKKRKHCYEDEINEPTTKKNKVVKLKEATGLVEPKRNVYQCKECKQDFDNFRALGGHMASHNRKMRSDDDLMNTSYKCPICHHVFNDFRALGGHIASHNRKDRAEKAALGGDSSLCIVAGSSVGSLRDKSYECNICYKKFLTGQALGGHKTYHRKIADSLIHAQENPEAEGWTVGNFSVKDWRR